MQLEDTKKFNKIPLHKKLKHPSNSNLPTLILEFKLLRNERADLKPL